MGWLRWEAEAGSCVLDLLGQEAKLVDARGADFVHHRDNVAILGPSVALHVDSLIETGGRSDP